MEFITYDKLNEYLEILTNSKSKNKVIKRKDLATSPCGFPITHYTIGNGPKHITVMAGTHGTEIIGIDFILKLMKVISEGHGVYKNFDSNKFTLDFIPCQNPEGFIIVTESLKPYVNNLTENEFEKLSKEYYLNYCKDDKVYIEINKLLSSLSDEKQRSNIIKKFWDENRLKDITHNLILNFCQDNLKPTTNLSDKIDELFKNFYELKIIDDLNDKVISKNKFHHQMFPDINYQNLPEKDERYILLKNKVKTIMETKYGNYSFNSAALVDWRANSNGVDLNKNNPNNFKIKNEEKRKNKFKPLFGNLRFVNLMREVPGPQGKVSISDDKFTFEKENIGLLKHLLNLKKEEKYVGALSYHGTGGVIYSRPKDYRSVKDKQKSEALKTIDTYNDEFAKAYQKITEYNIMPYPKELTGTGDMIRQMLPGFLIIELSKMGGNPLGPYGDKNNYKQVINDNIIAFNEILETITNKISVK